MISFVKPTDEHIKAISADMRREDAEEVWASHRHTPLEALTFGCALSDFSVTVVSDDGTPLVIIGLVKGDLLTGNGTVWMLGSNEALKYRKEFFRQTKPVIDEMLEICPRIGNMVHDKNRISISWLKRIGFIFGEQVELGRDKEIFHRFHIER